MASRIAIFGGQSNALGIDGTSDPGGLPLASVGFFRILGSAGAQNQTDTVTTTLRITATGTPSKGPECKAGIDVMAGAWSADSVAFVKCSQNGTAITTWLPSASQRYYQSIQRGCLSVRHLLSSGFSAYLVWNQGEAERDDAVAAAAWAANFTTIHTALRTWLGVATLPRIIIRLRSGLGTENATVRAQQASVADFLINRDDTAHVGDGVHDDGAAQNTIGERVAAALLAAG